MIQIAILGFGVVGSGTAEVLTENKELIAWYERLGEIRAAHPAFKEGEFIPIAASYGLMSYIRRCPEEDILTDCIRR